MIPINLILAAVCSAAKIDRHDLAVGKRFRDAYARATLVHLLADRRNMSVMEALEYANYSTHSFTTLTRTLAMPGCVPILAQAKWEIERTDRPVGPNILVEWPRRSLSLARLRAHEDVAHHLGRPGRAGAGEM